MTRLKNFALAALIIAGWTSAAGARAQSPFPHAYDLTDIAGHTDRMQAPFMPAGQASASFAGSRARHAAAGERMLGPVSYYGRAFAGRRTASGERFDPEGLTMAHPTLPFGTRVRVSVPHTDRSVVVRVNDRGPASGSRIADVSPAAARVLGFLRKGLASLHLEVISSVAGFPPASSPSDR